MSDETQGADDPSSIIRQIEGEMQLFYPESHGDGIREYPYVTVPLPPNYEMQDPAGANLGPQQKRCATIQKKEVSSGPPLEKRGTTRPPDLTPCSLKGQQYEILYCTSPPKYKPEEHPSPLWGSPSWTVDIRNGEAKDIFLEETTYSNIRIMAKFVGTITQDL